MNLTGFSRLPAFGCVLLSLATLSPRLPAAERWLVAHTAHFEVFSSASDSESRRIAEALEQFRANFLQSYPLRGASEPRTTVILFASDRRFERYKPTYEGKPKDVAGFFLPGTDEVVIALTNDVPEGTDATEVIYHEYVHLLLHARATSIPLWLDEGLAELYSTFRVEGKNVEFGLAKDSHVAVLNHASLLPLDRLFAVSHESPDYNEDERAGIFYAESWAFLHFLVCGADRANAAKLGAFIERISTSGSTAEGFREAFGADYSTVERSLRDYLVGGKYFKRVKPAALDHVDVTFVPATDAERDFALLNLEWRVHRSADAAARALHLAEQAPTWARPHELLAEIAAEDGDTATAQAHWLKAAELNSSNANVYVQLLRDALSGFNGAAFLDTRLPEARTEELRRWAIRALQFSPDNADALEQAALIEAMAPKFYVPNINIVQQHVLKMREPGRTLLGLAVVRWRANDAKTARTMIEMILSQTRADMATRSAADQLRSRLPGGGETAPAAEPVDLSPQALASRAAVALHDGSARSAAETLLDRLLDERGTTAQRIRLDPVVVTAVRGTAAADAWSRVEALRARAAAHDANAMFEIAVAHACGDGAEFSPTLAIAWLGHAAQAGHPIAQSGITPGDMDPDLLCRFLRKQHPTSAAGEWPPLDRDIQNRIAEAASAHPAAGFVILHRAPPRYPDAKRRAGEAGEVLVRFTIAPDGHAVAVKVAQASNPAFAATVEAIVPQWRFVPAIRDGQPAATFVECSVRFEPAPAN